MLAISWFNIWIMSQGYLWIIQLNASFQRKKFVFSMELMLMDKCWMYFFLFKKISWINMLPYLKNFNCKDGFVQLHCYIFLLGISFRVFAFNAHSVEQIFKIPMRESILFCKFCTEFLFANLFLFDEFVHALYALYVMASLLRQIYI